MVGSSRTRTIVFAIAAMLLLAGCGDSDSSNATSSDASGNAVDRAFVKDMVPHHESAVQMAQIAQRRGSSPFVNDLAEDIVRTQEAEIATLRAADQRLAAAGVTVGALGVPAAMMGMDHDVTSLHTADPFDPAFLRMMIPHHEGALVMSEAQLDKGKDPALKSLARAIITAQQREISAMRKQLGPAGTDHDAEHPG